MRKFLCYILLFFSLLAVTSCGEDRTYQYEEKTQYNQWMYDVMCDQYLWAEGLASYEPTWKSFFATPSSFLSTLTGKSGHSDSWSYLEVDTVSADSHERGYFNHLDSYGMDFSLMTDPTGQTTRQMLRVLTVYPHGAAAQAGLKRGDFICAYDGNKLSSSNVAKLKSGIARTLEVRHVAVNEEENSFYWSDTITISLGASGYVEDEAFPVSQVVDVADIRVGYLQCTRLVEYPIEQGKGRSDNVVYRDKLDQVMAQFQLAGLDELVLDLRLCNYGTLAMALRLASYVVAPSCLGSTFVKTVWNDTHTSSNQTLSYDASVGNLGLSRIYVLTSAYTQGAAEWLIHALQTSMGTENVVVVGLATQGQNVMTEEVAHQYYIRLHPVVAYVADAEGNYDYGSIAPTLSVNEQTYVVMGDYGSPDEILFYTAIANMLRIGQDDSENEEESDNLTDDKDEVTDAEVVE